MSCKVICCLFIRVKLSQSKSCPSCMWQFYLTYYVPTKYCQVNSKQMGVMACTRYRFHGRLVYNGESSLARNTLLVLIYASVKYYQNIGNCLEKKVREKSRECHNHKPQPFPDPKRKRKPTNLNKHKPNKRTKSTKISSLFPKRGTRNTKRTEKHKNKMTHGKTYNKSPRRINHKATKSKTNTGTTALERSVEQTTGGLKHFYS